MRRLLFAVALLSAMTLQAKRWTADEVKDIIRKVNTYWQTNNPAEVRSFWDNAAYHTGNMETYKLFSNEGGKRKEEGAQMLDYSIRWAEHNQWKGATEPDPANWKYKQYGEGQDYVLFGDWQICFQTYIDLYQIKNEEIRVKRALEVMGYEADSRVHDYWWWADALYMVMPVMTKMYKLTGISILYYHRTVLKRVIKQIVLMQLYGLAKKVMPDSLSQCRCKFVIFYGRR